MKKIEAVDLFCGVGGLSYGLNKSKIDVLAGVDIDPDSRYPYEENIKSVFIQKSVNDLTAKEVNSLYGRDSIKLLAGCAPCQPFSSYSQGPRGRGDDQWRLLSEFGRLVKGVKPDLVTMENVPKLFKHRVFKEFSEMLKDLGYSVDSNVIRCDLYGLPQTRKRLVLVASRFGEIEFIPPTHKTRTVRDVLFGQPSLIAGEIDQRDTFHRAATLTQTNLKRIKASKPGGTWRDWPKNLISECHKRGTGKTYSSVYGRMEWDKPAPTMTTQYFGFGNGRFGHPDQNRAISLREGAILQGFPKRYKFVRPDEEIHFTKVGRLIGNAVPPLLGELIGKTFHRHLKNFGIKD